MEVSGQLHAPGRSHPCIHWIWGWVGSRGGGVAYITENTDPVKIYSFYLKYFSIL